MYTYSLFLHPTLDQFRLNRVDPDVAGAVNHAVVLDGLRKLRQRFGRLGSEHDCDWRHGLDS